MDSVYTALAMPALIAKGRTMPTMATIADRRALRLMTVESISRPTANEEEKEDETDVCDEGEIGA